MSIESDLRKDGIEVIKKIDTLWANSIAKRVSTDLCRTFSDFGLDQEDLFIDLSRLNMYVAKIPEGFSEASYFYKNSSLYFSDRLSLSQMENLAIHECIHHIQERKDKRNYLVKMGLCDYTEFKIYGLALNEAAVQLMSAKVLGTPKDFVKYFNISFETNSPLYYPMECCLVNQLAYIVGENVLFESTLNSNDNFKKKLIELTDEKTYMKIENAIDSILLKEEEITKINNKIINTNSRVKKVDSLFDKISELKSSITNTFIETQNLIASTCFNKDFNNIASFEDADNYRRRLYNFKNYLGSTDDYDYFNKYYVDKMVELEEKISLIEHGIDPRNVSSVALIEIKETKFSKIIKFIKKLLGLKISITMPDDIN